MHGASHSTSKRPHLRRARHLVDLITMTPRADGQRAADLVLHGKLATIITLAGPNTQTPPTRRMAAIVCSSWLRELDLNQRPSGYEPDELPDCSIPRQRIQWRSLPIRPNDRVDPDCRSDPRNHKAPAMASPRK